MGNTERELRIIELENALFSDDNSSNEYPTNSIMAYGKICQHDDGHLCEHRKKWIIDFVKQITIPKQNNTIDTCAMRQCSDKDGITDCGHRYSPNNGKYCSYCGRVQVLV